MARRVRAAGFATNIGFSGFSGFVEGESYAAELADALRSPGPRHLVMCHPGFADDALARLDPLLGRRDEEYAALMARADLLQSMIRIDRPADQAGSAFAFWTAP